VPRQFDAGDTSPFTHEKGEFIGTDVGGVFIDFGRRGRACLPVGRGRGLRTVSLKKANRRQVVLEPKSPQSDSRDPLCNLGDAT